jgi:hypothetical protein
MMTVTTPRAPQERTPHAPFVTHWIAFIWAMEDHYAAPVRQTDAEVRAVAAQAAAFGVHPPTSLPSHSELVTTAR